MKTIWKFELEMVGMQNINLPKGAKILTVQTQNEKACLWALVEIDVAELEQRTIVTFGTGHPMPDVSLVYLGTYQVAGGALIFHVFEQIKQ